MNIINKIVSNKIINSTDKFINNGIEFTSDDPFSNKILPSNNDISKNIVITNDHIDINKVVKAKPSNYANVIKLMIILFILYILISSKFFTNTVLRLFGKKFVQDNSPTCLGLIIQAIILIFFYMLFSYLINKGAI
jgi:hypothetical protein